MIPDIKEVNFPDYATLDSAQVSQSDMGDYVITATIKIDGGIVPDFSYDWVVEFNGERYIHPLRKPQASKENTDMRSSVDLTFRHWAVVELQRYFFVEMTSIESGTAIPNKYIASLSLNLGDFIDALNKVLKYWYGDRIKAVLHENWEYAEEPTTVSISNTHIWNLLTQNFYELYGVRWHLVTEQGNADRAVIQFGYPADEIGHIFEYGFKGGLLKVERQVQSDDIRNILIGRGGEKNVPYRYFKNVDSNNPSFPADPDWIPELANIYFDRIRDAAFRSYVQGWKYRHYLNQLENSHYIPKAQAAVDWAWEKGFTDEKFDPVEFVADEIDLEGTVKAKILPDWEAPIKKGCSIDNYGSRWGALDDNDDIYPTIQGVSIDPIGRVDQVVAVGEVVTEEESEDSLTVDPEISYIKNITGAALGVKANGYATISIPITFYGSSKYFNNSPTITIPSDKTANFELGAPQISALNRDDLKDRDNHGAQVVIRSTTVTFYKEGMPQSSSGLTEGTYTAIVTVEVQNTNAFSATINVSYPNAKITIGDVSAPPEKKFANTFDVWVKNIWQTQKLASESDTAYAERVWKPILGGREGDEARIVFSTGWLSISEDYEFVIVKTPVYDNSKRLGDVQSEWRITLACTDADFDTLGVLVPNDRTHANAGDYFFFIGIDLPYLYYTEAEKRLTIYKRENLREVSDIKPTWVVNLDKVRIGRQQFDDLSPLLNQLCVGYSFRLTDPRFLQTVDMLYIQSITYNYNAPTNNDPYIVPDVEIVLSDTIATTASPISLLQGEVSSLQKQMGAIYNVEQIIRAVGNRLFLRKDGVSELSYSPTRFNAPTNFNSSVSFNSLALSDDFLMGNIGGRGWGFYRDSNGAAVIEVDRAIIRQNMEVSNLVINQISARGGMVIESAASMAITLVVDSDDGYYCYFDQKQGSIANLFVVDDIAFNEQWDADNTSPVYYKRRVLAVGEDYILLSKTDKSGDGIPAEGDIVVQFGNYTNKSRQYVIVRDVVDGGYERFVEGLDSVTAQGREYWYVGRQGEQGARLFIGNREDNQYIEYKDGKLYIPGSLILGAPLEGGSTMLDYIKENGGLSEEEVRDLAQQEADKAAQDAQKSAERYADTVVKASQEYLQSQIDGAIETWFYAGVPTLKNEPASAWETDEQKNVHLGDLYYDQNTGKCYRFQLDADKNYEWHEITDTDIQAAMEAANQAQETANGKRRVFLTTPTTPYDEGDLWVNATYGTLYKDDILRCNKSRESGSFEIDDWGLASKYTDDTLAKEALNEIAGYEYLKRALEKGRTEIEGGLMLTSLIELGTWNGSQLTVWSGINGQPTTDAKKGYGIAAWYGGDMIDGENDGWTGRVATSLFRFDGSGYLAHGNITWDVDGNGSVGRDAKGNPLIKWDKGGVQLSDTIQISVEGDVTLGSILTELARFNSMFELDTTTLPGKTLIKARYDGFYSEGEIAALGVVSGMGGNTGGNVDLTGYAREDWVKELLKGYASTEYVDQKVAEALTGGQVDLSGYLTKTEAQQTYQPKGSYLTSHQSIYALTLESGQFSAVTYDPKSGAKTVKIPTLTSHLTNDLGFITSEALTGYAKTSDIPSLEGYAKETWVTAKGYITSAALNGYATEIWVEGKGYLTQHQSLANYPTRDEVTRQIADAVTGGKVDLTGYATEKWVTEQGYLKQHQSLDDYLTKADAADMFQLRGDYLTSSALNGYATQDWVEGKKYLTAHQSLADYAKTADIQSWVQGRGYLTSSALNGYATQTWVSGAFAVKNQSAAVDLDTLGDSGILNCAADATATPERNYPLQQAGIVIYGLSAHNRTNQIYGSYNSNRWFARGSGVLAMTAWREFAFIDNLPKNVSELNNDAGYITLSSLTWNNITGKPTTLGGYGITDAYTKTETTTVLSQYLTDNGYAKKSDIPSLAEYMKTSTANATFVTALGVSGNNLTWTKNGTVNNITVPYATNADTLDGYHETDFFRQRGKVSDDYYNGTTYETLTSGVYIRQLSGSSAMMIHFQNTSSSASGLDLYTAYTATSAIYFRKNIDSNRFSSTAWSYFITSDNISSQHVASATSATTATQLANTRTFWGQSFNGTQNIDGLFRSLITGSPSASGAGTLCHKILGYPTNPYGLHTYIHQNGCSSIQCQRENSTTEYFAISINPLGGYVGVGTVTPTHNLHVVGSFYASGATTLASTLTVSGAATFASTVKIGEATLSWDATNKALKTDTSFYSDKEIAALGAASISGGTSGGGTSYDRLDTWSSYSPTMAGWVLSAGLGYDLYTTLTALSSRVSSLEGSAGQGGGLDESQLAQYLTSNNYAKKSDIPSLTEYMKTSTANASFVTSLNTSDNYLTWSKNGTTNNITVPYATASSILNNYFTIRQASANVSYGDGTLRKFLATSTMTTGKPMGDGTILHLSWDNQLVWDSQLYIPSGDATGVRYMQYRYQNGTSEWISWRTLIDSSNISGYLSNYATQSWVEGKKYLTTHQSLYKLTFQGGTFSTIEYTPNSGTATVNIPTHTSHLTNNSGFITSSALNGYATTASLANYLPLSGGTMSNTNKVANLNADLLDGYDSEDFLRRYRAEAGLNVDTNSTYAPEILEINGATGNAPFSGWSQIFNLGSTDKNYGYQIAVHYNAFDPLKYRSRVGGGWNTWRTIIDNSNISSYNAGSASKLQTTHTLWGQNFDGTQNVSGDLMSVGSITSNKFKIIPSTVSAVDSGLIFSNTNGVYRGHIAFYQDHFYIANYVNSKENSYISLYNNGNIHIGGGGNIGIETSTPSYKLHVVGNIYATGEITAGSDMRLKSDIRTLKYRGSVRPVEFFKEGRRSIGFIAQEVRELYPELIFEDCNTGYLSMNYGGYTAVLQAQLDSHATEMKTMKEILDSNTNDVEKLKIRITEQSKRIAELENELATLRNR